MGRRLFELIQLLTSQCYAKMKININKASNMDQLCYLQASVRKFTMEN